jgi:P-type conjugative transfer protein TrbL
MGTWSPEFFQSVLTPFVSNFGWVSTIFNLAGPIYWMLATIALGWVLLEGFVNRDAAGCASNFAITIIGIGTAWVLFTNASVVGFAIYNTLVQLATGVSGVPQSAASPDGLMVFGYQIAQVLWTAVGFGTWFIHPVSAIIILLIGLGIFLLYLWMAIQLMYLIIEGFFAIVGGSMFIPFGAFVWTRNFLVTWLSWILGVSFQLFFTYLILGVGLQLAAEYLADITSSSTGITSDIVIAATALAQALVFWSLLVVIPKIARQKIDGGMGIAPGSGGMMGVLGAVISGGAMAAGAVGAAASAASKVGSTHQSEVFSRMMMQP